jgi:serine/threonine protein phosphatase PrpC
MLCSDGLWNYLPDAADLAARAMPEAQSRPLDTARALVDFALDAGGHDNITVVLAPFPPEATQAATGAEEAAEPPTQPQPRIDAG